MDNYALVKLEHIFKTLSYRKRLALLVYLLEGEATISRLSIALELPYKTTERNLINLVEAGFIIKRTVSNQTFFCINHSAEPLHSYLIRTIKEKCQKLDMRQLAKSLLTTAMKVDNYRRYVGRETGFSLSTPVSRESDHS